MSSYLTIKFLPLNKGYGEHPYWLIEKMNYILGIINKVYNES